MRTKVAIFGGGVAGMSAAHELCERGYEVEVFERRSSAGGKARSVRVDVPRCHMASADPGAKPWLPGEHGFRFFPGFYRHVVDTMARIPYGAGHVAGNLVEAPEVHIARNGEPKILLPARFPLAPGELKTAVFFALGMMAGQLRVTSVETAFLATKLWQLLTSCEERRANEYEKIDWWTFIEAEGRSAAYQQVFGHCITRSLVAAKARLASTKTIGDIFLQMLLSIAQIGTGADRLLNGPTNDVWIDPWLAYLRARGVRYHTDAELVGLELNAGAIRSAAVATAGHTRAVVADYFIVALPIERIAPLITSDLAAADPALANLRELSDCVDWMNGIQYFLREDVPIARGHSIYLDSQWALTSVSQAQFWQDHRPATFADGKVRGIISVDISDWEVPGGNGKSARQCDREEIAEEVWSQLKNSLNVGGEVLLHDDQRMGWVLDADIVDSDRRVPGFETNAEPMLVNYVDTWRLRPDAAGRIQNLMLAADYVRTHTDLATMEGANEAARRAVNAIIERTGNGARPCELWKMHEPNVLAPLREYDAVRYRRGLPWDGELMDVVQSALRASEGVARLAHLANGPAPGSASMQRSEPRLRILP